MGRQKKGERDKIFLFTDTIGFLNRYYRVTGKECNLEPLSMYLVKKDML